jgi:hypothetical protein
MSSELPEVVTWERTADGLRLVFPPRPAQPFWLVLFLLPVMVLGMVLMAWELGVVMWWVATVIFAGVIALLLRQNARGTLHTALGHREAIELSAREWRTVETTGRMRSVERVAFDQIVKIGLRQGRQPKRRAVSATETRGDAWVAEGMERAAAGAGELYARLRDRTRFSLLGGYHEAFLQRVGMYLAQQHVRLRNGQPLATPALPKRAVHRLANLAQPELTDPPEG